MNKNPDVPEYRITVSLVAKFENYPEVDGLLVKMRDSNKNGVMYPVTYLEWVKVTKLEE